MGHISAQKGQIQIRGSLRPIIGCLIRADTRGACTFRDSWYVTLWIFDHTGSRFSKLFVPRSTTIAKNLFFSGNGRVEKHAGDQGDGRTINVRAGTDHSLADLSCAGNFKILSDHYIHQRLKTVYSFLSSVVRIHQSHLNNWPPRRVT